MAKPGMLYVTMQPHPSLPPAEFHDWYNNEHGPIRLRIPQIFQNGLRLRLADPSSSPGAPEFLATYDVRDMSLLETETYLTLRANRSQREAKTIAQIDVKRYFWDWLFTKQDEGFSSIEELEDEEATSIVTVAVQITPTEHPDAGEQYQKWLSEEHVGMLAKVPGWLRTRLFKTSTLEMEQKLPTYLALHDYRKDNGLGGEAHKASMDTPWRTEVFDKYVASKSRLTYNNFYVFGPAPRDLSSLLNRAPTAAFHSSASYTTTIPGTAPVISSYFATSDALKLIYHLEGNTSHNAPTVAFANSLLTSHHMWDPFVAILKANRPDLRILRYDFRGRASPIPEPATLPAVTDDIKVLLDALRISKLHALIGVSMGGATTLNFALTHPSRLDRFIACDFNCTSSPANTQAWKDRIAVARSDNNAGIRTLAAQTVSRWFHPATIEAAPATVSWMTDMVAKNDVEGFAHSCTVLWDYDLKPQMPTSSVPGILVVGEADANGAVVKAMEGFKGLIGKDGADLRIVPKTGHLPMCEDPEVFWEIVKDFL